MYSVYKVLNGEPLESVASKFGTSVRELEMLNGLEERLLRATNEIIVPETSKKYFEYYRVQKGDRVFMGNNEYYKKIMKKYKAF